MTCVIWFQERSSVCMIVFRVVVCVKLNWLKALTDWLTELRGMVHGMWMTRWMTRMVTTVRTTPTGALLQVRVMGKKSILANHKREQNTQVDAAVRQHTSLSCTLISRQKLARQFKTRGIIHSTLLERICWNSAKAKIWTGGHFRLKFRSPFCTVTVCSYSGFLEYCFMLRDSSFLKLNLYPLSQLPWGGVSAMASEAGTWSLVQCSSGFVG